jgi:hypothetical protein
MSNNEKMAGEFYNALLVVLTDRAIDDAIIKKIAADLAANAVGSASRGRKKLMTVKKTKGKIPTVVYYNPIAAIRAIAHAIEAIADPTNYILAGAAAISCGAALREMRRVVTPAEGALFWLLCNCENYQAGRGTASDMFSDFCEGYQEIKAEDFTSALQSLLTSEFISEDKNNTLHVVERVYRSNIAPIYEA